MLLVCFGDVVKKKLFMLLFGHVIDITCFVCEDKNFWWLFHFWNVLFFNFFRNVSFTDRNLMFGIMSRNSFSNAYIWLHCGGVLFDLNPKFSRRISLSWFSCKKKWALERIPFTIISIFAISLIRYDLLDGIGMFFNE